SANYNIDTKRVYATGHSSGGGMAFVLGLTRWQKFAAIAVVASPFAGGIPNLGIAMPTLYIQGTADPIVPISGGAGYLGSIVPTLDTSLSGWAGVLGCAGQPRTVVSHDNGVEISNFAGCVSSVPFEVMLVDGMGHRWPGGSVPDAPDFVL